MPIGALISATPVVGVNFADLMQEILPLLNAGSLPKLTVSNETELYEWADEKAQGLARRIGIFVERDASLQVSQDEAQIDTPARHLSTLHVWKTSNNQWIPLYPTSIAELDALNVGWETTTAEPSKWTQDQQGTVKIRVYPTAQVDTPLAAVYHEHPDTISVSQAQLTAPAIVRDYFLWELVGEARSKQTDEMMPEVAQYARERADLYEQLFGYLWGVAQ